MVTGMELCQLPPDPLQVYTTQGGMEAIVVFHDDEGAAPRYTPVWTTGGEDGHPYVRVEFLTDGRPAADARRGHYGWVDPQSLTLTRRLPDGEDAPPSGG